MPYYIFIFIVMHWLLQEGKMISAYQSHIVNNLFYTPTIYAEMHFASTSYAVTFSGVWYSTASSGLAAGDSGHGVQNDVRGRGLK